MPPVVTANVASRWAAMRTGHPATRRAALGFLLGGLASSVLAPGGACAAGDPRRRVALVMGNQNYEHVARLLNTANDAHAMADQLRQRGFDVVEGYDLNRPAMIQKLGEFLKKLSSGTIAVVYFAGHGVQANGENVLLPTDIRGDGEVAVSDNGILLTTIMRRMGGINDRQGEGFNLLIVDACRDNPFPAQDRSYGAARGLASTGEAGTMVLYSAGGNQRALDSDPTDPKGQHGLFVTVLLREMREPDVDIRAMINRVRSEVERVAARAAHEQTPALYDQATTTPFAFTPGDVPQTAAFFAMPRQLPTPAQNKVGWLGVRVGTPDRGIGRPLKGVPIAEVDDQGPAKKGGIRPGDTILRFNNKAVSDPRELEKLVTAARGLPQVAVRIERNSDQMTIQVANPTPPPPPRPVRKLVRPVHQARPFQGRAEPSRW